MHAVHADGTRLPVSLQQPTLKLEQQEEPFYAAWICFHREYPPTTRMQSTEEFESESKSKNIDYLSDSKFPDYLLEHEEPLDISDFKILQSLGEGSFSFVRLCTYIFDPSQVFASNIDTICNQICNSEPNLKVDKTYYHHKQIANGNCNPQRNSKAAKLPSPRHEIVFR